MNSINTLKNLLHLFKSSFFVLLLFFPSLGLNLDGTLLLSFRYSILSDPLSVLDNWDYTDPTPCSWAGVKCAADKDTPGSSFDDLRVVALSLPKSNLIGVIPEDLGLIPRLKMLDLSDNFLNGTLPRSLFNRSGLQVVSLSNNGISGRIPEFGPGPTSLKTINLSGNGLTGEVPKSIASMQNLTMLSLRDNFLTGQIPIKIQTLQFLDLSSNSLSGPLPPDFGGSNLRYLNLSSNKLSGFVPREFSREIPGNATIDLSFNNLSGEIPDSSPLSNQKEESFQGNLNLCGKPMKKLCVVPSTVSTLPNLERSNGSSSPAIAAIPKPINSNPSPDYPTTNPNEARNNQTSSQHGLKPGSVAGIMIVPLAGIGLFVTIFVYIHRKRKRANGENKEVSHPSFSIFKFEKNPSPSSLVVKEKETKNLILNLNFPTWPCLSTKKGDHSSEEDSTDHENGKDCVFSTDQDQTNSDGRAKVVIRSLVMVDGETELEPDTLFRASAYVLGSSGPNIVYKAVLRDGTSFAVRRIGEVGCGGMKEFERRVRAIAKMGHPNLVRVRGFYWGDDEKLVICDYVSNGSLANVGYRKIGSSPYQLPFRTLLNIAKGVARGLAHIHDNKNVHGNIKPSNILLTHDMEPVISDFGLDWLVHGKKPGHIGSARSMGPTSPYQAPESFDNTGPSSKWDIYSFGILSIELLTGKVFSGLELSQLAPTGPDMLMRMADVAMRGDMAGWEEAVLMWLKLGFSCASLAPQKRPCMRRALLVLEQISCPK